MTNEWTPVDHLSREEREALILKIQNAYETLPDGWRKNTAAEKGAPFVHKDGRESWKHPGRDALKKLWDTNVAGMSKKRGGGPSQQQERLLKRLRSMVKNGVPIGAVEQRARLEGIDPTLLLPDANESEEPKKKSPQKITDGHKKSPLTKYRKMLEAGIPMAAVEQRAVTVDGVDPALFRKAFREEIDSSVEDEKQEPDLTEEDGEEKQVVEVEPAVVIEANDTGKEDETPDSLFHFVGASVEFSNGTDLTRLVTKMVQTISKRPIGSQQQLTVSTRTLYHALGAFRGVQHSRDMYNSTINGKYSITEANSKRKPFLELTTSLGMSPPTDWKQAVDIKGLDEIVCAIELAYKDELDTIHESLEVGMYDFDTLAQLYTPGTRVVAKNAVAGGVDMLVEVLWNRYEQGRTLFGVSKSFQVSFQFLVAVGKHFTLCEFVENIGSFEGSRHVKNLNFVPFSMYSEHEIQLMNQRFRQRGELYSKIAVEPKYLAYEKGAFHAKRAGGSVSIDPIAALHSSGRAMVDTQAGYEAGHTLGKGSEVMIMGIKYVHKEYNLLMLSRKGDEGKSSNNVGDTMALFDSVPDEYLDMCWPAVVGFSFTSKAWGDILVDGLDEIEFREGIFDMLVLPESRKRMVKALVQHSNDSFNDIVSGKGEGSVFLLYGGPGIGKTLTAEAVCEMLHKPLYSVSLGQLGTTPVDLEKNLAGILHLCGRWEALILLDEADIFLEKRSSTGSLQRNAMVSVMLRLVEYFKGVLFLTSNRVDRLDPAFKTRITLALRYDSLDQAAREKVWLNLLGASGFADSVKDGSIVTAELAKYELNGREIKNAIRLGMALAADNGKTLSQDVLLETVSILNEFNAEMEAEKAY
jgi:hypothetical protein